MFDTARTMQSKANNYPPAQPCAQAVAVDRLMHWLFQNAQWEDSNYTDQVIPTEL